MSGWVDGAPLFALCGMLAFGINWLVFIPAYIWQTERFFDLTGSLTYLTVVAVALAMTLGGDPRSLLLAGMVSVWVLCGLTNYVLVGRARCFPWRKVDQ